LILYQSFFFIIVVIIPLCGHTGNDLLLHMEWLFRFAFKLPVNHHFLRNKKNCCTSRWWYIY